jgi:hypothetical protein
MGGPRLGVAFYFAKRATLQAEKEATDPDIAQLAKHSVLSNAA